MKKTMIAALIVAANWLTALPGQAAPVLSISPSANSTTVGGSVSTDLVISGLTAFSEIVSGFDIDVFFNPAVLSATTLTTLPGPWGTLGDIQVNSSIVAPGHVEFRLIAFNDDATLAGLQGNSFVLSTIDFLGLTDGFSTVSFGTDPDFERNVVGRDALSLPLTAQGTCIAVGTGVCPQDLPEPSTAPLVLVALAAGGWVMRRRGNGEKPRREFHST